MSETGHWNSQVARIRVSLLKMAIDNEIMCRETPPEHSPLFRIAGETLRDCLLLIEGTLKDCPGYTDEIVSENNQVFAQKP